MGAERQRREAAMARAAEGSATAPRHSKSPVAAEAAIKRVEKQTEPRSAKVAARVFRRITVAARRTIERAPRPVQQAARTVAALTRTTRQHARVHLMHLGAKLTVSVDKVVARAPRRIRPLLGIMRDLNPVHVVAFAADRFKRDPVFFTPYMIGSNVVSDVTVPVVLALGFSAPVAIAAYYWTVPLDLVALVIREQHLRRKADPSLTTSQVGRQLASEYRVRAEARRQRGRDYLAELGEP